LLNISLIWVGIAVALLDITGLASRADELFDKLLFSSWKSVRSGQLPFYKWMYEVDTWFIKQALVRNFIEGDLQKYSIDCNSEEVEEAEIQLSYEEITKRTTFIYVACLAIIRVFLGFMATTLILLPLAILAIYYYELLISLEALEWHAVAISFLSFIVLSCILFNHLFMTVVLVIYHAIRISIASFFFLVLSTLVLPLWPFRKLNRGYISTIGLLVALTGLSGI